MLLRANEARVQVLDHEDHRDPGGGPIVASAPVTVRFPGLWRSTPYRRRMCGTRRPQCRTDRCVHHHRPAKCCSTRLRRRTARRASRRPSLCQSTRHGSTPRFGPIGPCRLRRYRAGARPPVFLGKKVRLPVGPLEFRVARHRVAHPEHALMEVQLKECPWDCRSALDRRRPRTSAWAKPGEPVFDQVTDLIPIRPGDAGRGTGSGCHRETPGRGSSER